LIEVYLKEFVVSRVKFNHQEFQSFYEANLSRFREPEELKLRQVQVSSKIGADSAAALLKDGADFDYVADRFRQGSKEMSEKTEWVKLTSFPESIRDQMERLLPGQSSPALATSEGWVIFKVLDRKQGRQKTLEEVDMQIREAMFQDKFNALLDGTLAKIKEHSEIIYYDDAIEDYLGADN
jgi:parvulin-like peptidyl-prolyl isomerase